MAVMGVPESLSYAQIAGLPFEFGLCLGRPLSADSELRYALIVPQLVYSLLGQSRQPVG